MLEITKEQAMAFATDDQNQEVAKAPVLSHVPRINVTQDAFTTDNVVTSSNTSFRKTVRIYGPPDDHPGRHRISHCKSRLYK